MTKIDEVIPGPIEATAMAIETIAALKKQAVDNFALYLSERSSAEPEKRECAIEAFDRAVCGYLMWRLRPDLFKSVFVDPASAAAKQIRRDLGSLKESLDGIRSMLHRTVAGQLVLDRMSENAKQRQRDELGVLVSMTEELLAGPHHAAGRTKSPEKEARIRLIAGIILAARKAGVTSGSGIEGPFGRYLAQLFNTLSIETIVSSREIADATRRVNGPDEANLARHPVPTEKKPS